MSEENVETVRVIYEAINRNDWDAAFSKAAPDFRLTTQLGPEAGTRRGREEAVAFVEDLRGAFVRLTWEPEEFFDLGSRVVVFVAVRSRPRNADRDLVVRNGHLWTIDKGTVLSMQSFPSPEDAVKAAGPSE
jgi:ketosteroid isomerase-like protein